MRKAVIQLGPRRAHCLRIIGDATRTGELGDLRSSLRYLLTLSIVTFRHRNIYRRLTYSLLAQLYQRDRFSTGIVLTVPDWHAHQEQSLKGAKEWRRGPWVATSERALGCETPDEGLEAGERSCDTGGDGEHNGSTINVRSTTECRILNTFGNIFVPADVNHTTPSKRSHLLPQHHGVNV